MKNILFAFLINLVAFCTLYGQESTLVAGQSMAGLQKILHTEIRVSPLLDEKMLSNRPATLEEKLISAKTNPQQIPLVYAYKDLALFCKLEVKLEQTVQMPIKVRLGSVDYVDWLEGKRDNYNYWWLVESKSLKK